VKISGASRSRALLLWVAPRVFVGAQVGVGVLDRSDVNVGISIGVAARPFGRMR
jgi:hypothetical protein